VTTLGVVTGEVASLQGKGVALQLRQGLKDAGAPLLSLFRLRGGGHDARDRACSVPSRFGRGNARARRTRHQTSGRCTTTAPPGTPRRPGGSALASTYSSPPCAASTSFAMESDSPSPRMAERG